MKLSVSSVNDEGPEVSRDTQKTFLDQRAASDRVTGPGLVSVSWDEQEEPRPLMSVIQLSWGTPHLRIWLGFLLTHP